MRVQLTKILAFFISSSEAKVKKGLNNLYRIIKKALKGISIVENNNSQTEMFFGHNTQIRLVN